MLFSEDYIYHEEHEEHEGCYDTLSLFVAFVTFVVQTVKEFSSGYAIVAANRRGRSAQAQGWRLLRGAAPR